MGSSGNSNITLRTLKFGILVIIACCFVYCNTSNNKITSSFLKRKYTKGHFSDRPGKVNTYYITYNNIIMPDDIKPAPERTLDNIALPNSNQRNDKLIPFPILFPKLLKYAGSITRNNNKVSYSPSPEGPASLPGHPDIKHNDHGFAKAKPYLVGLAICVAVILFMTFLIASPTEVSANYVPFGGCFFILIALLAAIVGIVFLILFLCALAPPAS